MIDRSPLRIDPGRLRLWAVGLAAMGLAPVLGAFAFGFHDWPAFWSAGATVGTADLVDPIRHAAWQRDHGLPAAFFPYPAGTAWLFAPLALVPLDVSFVLHAVVMAAAVAAAGWVAGPVFGLDRSATTLALASFAPVTASLVLGQNGALGLLLAVIAIAGLVERRSLVTGLAIGVLLYKPTYGLPLVGLLVLRRRWTELAVVVVVAIAWYAAGVAATGGDLRWPTVWIGGISGYLEADFAGNADKAISVPGLLRRVALPDLIPLLATGVIVGLSLPRLAAAPILEAACAACLVGVVASPHAWGYDAALAAPFLLWLLAGYGPLREPARTPLLVALWMGSLLWLVSRQTVVSAVALIVIGLALVWIRDWFVSRPSGEMAATRSVDGA